MQRTRRNSGGLLIASNQEQDHIVTGLLIPGSDFSGAAECAFRSFDFIARVTTFSCFISAP